MYLKLCNYRYKDRHFKLQIFHTSLLLKLFPEGQHAVNSIVLDLLIYLLQLNGFSIH